MDAERLAKLPRAGGLLLCFGCQVSGACRLGITAFRADRAGRYIAEAVCGTDQLSGPEIAHGGWVAGVLDEVVGLACIEELQQLVVTARLEITYRRPTPTGVPLRIEAVVEEAAASRVRATGALVLAATGDVLATGAGEWVIRPPRRAP